MQFKPTFSDNHILTSPIDSPFDFLTDPIEKVECVGEVIRALNYNRENKPFCELRIEAVETLGTILVDAAADLKHLQKLFTERLGRQCK